ncbi:discoidin domain-containing receptor 2-like isoform X3 [Cimex lectularius]|uniref:Discoidin domain receptor n=1 Tax=Cimex lectularius TaxID=79782 RepID=A0A8I6RCS1_CIMLE|nr:discoidin domain-containing receptor 2-like isoform X3 [Cimex lectularius]
MWFIVFVVVFLPPWITCLDLVRCGSPLGMESGDIPDSAISASSAYDSASVGPYHARLKHDKNGGAWCPRAMVSKDSMEFLQIDLGKLRVITGTRTQGRFGNGQGQEYTEEFYLDYWRPGFTKWHRWKNRTGSQKLTGNTNTYTVVEQKVDPVIIASKIRFLPYSLHVRTACMRVDMLGCYWQEGVVSYSMPQGERKPGEFDLRDNTYDGSEDGGWLSGGLGQLVDGHKGQDNFNLDVYGHGKGYEWIGWRNDSFGIPGRPVEIVFEFDTLRNFSAMYIHMNNAYTKEVQVFSLAKVYMSVGGKLFSGKPIEYSYMPDTVMEHARNVTIKLHHMAGKFLKLQLYFEHRWMMISEVSFDSVILPINMTEESFFDNQIVPQVDTNKEVPLQRDAVHTTPSKEEPKKSVGISGINIGSPKEPESRHLIGLLIIALATVILLLLVAIVFIVVRTRKVKTSQNSTSDNFQTEKNMRGKMNSNGHVYGQVSRDEPEKSILFHKPLPNHINMYGFQSTQPTGVENTDYSEVPDIVQEYAIPLVNTQKPPTAFHTNVPPMTPIRTLPPIHNFFPKPPPVPPPPEKYYAATEIVQNAPPIPLSPPTSLPPSIGACSSASSYGHLMNPPSLEEELANDYEIRDIPRKDMKFNSKLGEGYFGEVYLFELIRVPNSIRLNSCKYVAVKALRKDAPNNLRDEFEREMEDLLALNNENIINVLGACMEKEPHLLVLEYSEQGDLYQFLQNHISESASLQTNANVLSHGSLIYMGAQVASGMKYLEQNNFVFKDLATRNCIVGLDYSIKVGDLGIGRNIYPADYFEIPGRGFCPVRWMSWESIILDKYTIKSVVWSFAVTLWEILTFAREQPFEDLTDDKVVENAQCFELGNGKQITLNQPINCNKEIYDLMCECWQRKESVRPSFKEIHMFLQRKNLGYKPCLKS